MRSALVHDWLISPIGGSENVLEAIHRLFPSPIFTLVQNKEKLQGSYFQNLEISSSFIQKLPWSATKYKNYLPFFPIAIEQFDLTAFDLILSSSHCVAKGVVTHSDQLHICYCHTPVRYAWDLCREYLKDANLERGVKGAFAKWVLRYIRNWDAASAHRVDHFIANSRFVARRIEKFYGREAHVIYPPVNVNHYQMQEQKEDYYVAASRFVPYKKIQLIVEAFSRMPHRKLVVIGDGPEREKIRRAAGQNIELLGETSPLELRKYLQNAKAFVFAAVEDFGILPVEAMASGTPVIAFGKGAVLETVIPHETGLFYPEQTAESLCEAVQHFETRAFDPQKCRKQAEKFSQEEFNRQFHRFVINKYTEYESNCLGRRRRHPSLASF